jgi:hypothetical protein
VVANRRVWIKAKDARKPALAKDVFSLTKRLGNLASLMGKAVCSYYWLAFLGDIVMLCFIL